MRNAGIGDWITRRAQRAPAATALVDVATGRRETYAELEDRVAAAAEGLHDLGIRQGDRVALLADNSAEYLELLFATARLGAITVPVNTRLAAAEIAYVLEDSGAVALAVSAGYREIAEAALSRPGHRVAHTLAIGDSGAGLDELIQGRRGSRPPNPVRGDDVCVIMYTSGTTGRPKGAMLTHDNMLWNAVNLLTAGKGISGADITLAVAPLFHIGALGLSALPVLYAGGTVVVPRGFDPEQTLRLMAEERVTTQFMVPAMWAALTKVPDLDRFDLSALRWVLCGGAPCPLAVIEYFTGLGWTFMEGFGMTELSPAALYLESRFVVSHAGSVGRPFMHVDARLVDADDHDVAPGEVGELVLRGPTVFAGYWGRPEETAEAMRGGWFHSGDLGVADADGFVKLVDRKKDMIISGGENVYPIEVEQVLHRHPGVADVAVVGVPDERWGETVLAVVVPAADPVDPDELTEFARQRLAHFKCPRRVEFAEVLPRNATGKLLKRVLRETYTGSAATVHR